MGMDLDWEGKPGGRHTLNHSRKSAPGIPATMDTAMETAGQRESEGGPRLGASAWRVAGLRPPAPARGYFFFFCFWRLRSAMHRSATSRGAGGSGGRKQHSVQKHRTTGRRRIRMRS